MMEAVRIQNERLALEVLPGCGGRVTSLLDRRRGREWLWRNPHLTVREPAYGASYIAELDGGGWDEVLPSVSPTRVGVVEIPDHGDLVRIPWQVRWADASSLHLCADGRCLPFRFERRLELQAETPRLRAEYRLAHTGGDPFPYLWCAHLLLAAAPGMRLRLPEGLPFRVASLLGRESAEAATVPLWPVLPLAGGGALDLSVVPDPGAEIPWAAKVFVPCAGSFRFRLDAPDGGGLSLGYAGGDIPWLGFWMNYGAWSGCGSAPYFNLGIEPATTPCDDLAEAVRNGEARMLAPGGEREWELELEVD